MTCISETGCPPAVDILDIAVDKNPLAVRGGMDSIWTAQSAQEDRGKRQIRGDNLSCQLRLDPTSGKKAHDAFAARSLTWRTWVQFRTRTSMAR